MGNLEKGKSPIVYIFAIVLLCVGVFLVVNNNDEDINQTLGTIVAEGGPHEDITEIDLDGLDRDLFFGEEDTQYSGDEICQQFSSEYVMGIIDHRIVQVQEITNGNNVGCIYHLESNNSTVSILMKNGSLANEKRGHELIGRSVSEDPETDDECFVIRNGKNEIIEVYLVILDTRYLQIGMNAGDEYLGEGILTLARDISRELSIYHLD